jgi:pimeloyl-ACP methyl ester carboxylesterase
MHRRIHGSELLVLKDGSHGAPIEYPDVINLRLEKFLIAKGLLPA